MDLVFSGLFVLWTGCIAAYIYRTEARLRALERRPPPQEPDPVRCSMRSCDD